MAHYRSSPASHPGEKRFYDTLQQEFYWTHMSSDAYTMVADCQSCTAQGTRNLRPKKFRLFSAAGPLQFVAMDILDPLSKTKPYNQHVIVLTDRYTRLTRTMPATTLTPTNAATVFVDNWVIPYGILTYSLTDNGPYFVSKLFRVVTACLGVKHLITTAYHPHINSKVERFIRTIVARL